MRVIIASTSVPLVNGGYRLIVEWTAEAMRAEGHQVEEYFLPFPTAPRPTLSALLGLRATPFGGSGDRLVAIRWPAHILKHENKATWFIHHYRQLFDLWNTPHRGMASDVEAGGYREALRRIDNQGLGESRDVFANSARVQERLRTFNDVESTILLPPLGGDLSRFRTETYGDFIFYPSRITPIKRQMLAVRALRHTSTPVRLVIAGRTEAPHYEKEIRDFVREQGLEDRVELRLSWISEDEKADLYARCLALAYLPVDEDSYGYPSLEASHSRKPIVTLTDAGGALEFVRNDREGFIVEPNAMQLARVFDRLYEDRAEAERLGQQAFDRRAELDISWPHVVRRLLGDQT